MGEVEELVKLVGIFRPVWRPREPEWKRLESCMGLELPADYKAIVSTLGLGQFGRVLFLRNPAAPGHFRLSIENLREYREMIKQYEGAMGIRFYPSPNGVIHVGITGMPIEIGIRPPDRDLPRWRVVVCDFDRGVVHDFDMLLSEFLVRLYKREIKNRKLDNFRDCIWPRSDGPFFTPLALEQSKSQ